jgi:hypothetical protein
VLPGRIALIVGATVAGFALAPSAQAATFKSGFLTYVTQAADTTSGTAASPVAECPAGRRVAGVGASLGGPGRTDSPSSRIAAIYPADGGDPGLEIDDAATAELYNGSDGTVKSTAYAVCVSGPAGALDLTYSSQPSSSNPFDPPDNIATGQTVNCPGGKVVGGGERITGPNGEETLRASGPRVLPGGGVDSGSWSTSFNIAAVAASHNAFANAVCYPGDELKLRYRYRTKVLLPDDVKTVDARCRSGERVIGGGWRGQPLQVLASRPVDSRDTGKAPDDGWAMKARISSGGDPLAVVTHAICAKLQ